MNPDITIIIPLFNKEKFIKETINSVLSQTFYYWHLIIIDDCSTDMSYDIISSFKNDDRIFIFKNDVNKGANYCRNFGLNKSNSKYIIFLDADDILHEDCLYYRLNKTIDYPGFHLYVFQMGIFKNTIYDDSRLWIPNSKSPLNDFLEHRLPWSILQPLWNADILKQINGFDENFKRFQDVELSTRYLLFPNIKVKQFTGFTDCFYRISLNRISYNFEEYLNRQAEASIKYYNKFYNLVSTNQKKKLLGTLFRVVLTCVYHFNQQHISKTFLIALKNNLIINTVKTSKIKSKNKLALYLFIFININLKPIKGFNYVAQKVITN